MRYSGTSTVSFIASLVPLYTREYVGELACARSLHDGTLILPKAYEDDESSGMEDWVSVWWQGDRSKAIDVPAGFIATKQIIEYVKLHSIGRTEGFSKHLQAHLVEHYERSTGQETVFYPQDKTTLGKVLGTAEKYGYDIVVGYLSGALLEL